MSAGSDAAVTQGRRDSNPQPPVLETGALPIELLPSGEVRNSDRGYHRPSLALPAGTSCRHPTGVGGGSASDEPTAPRATRRGTSWCRDSAGDADAAASPGGDEDGARRAGGGGGGDSAGVGHATAAQHRCARRGARPPPRGWRGCRRATRVPARAPRCAAHAGLAAACGTAPVPPGNGGSGPRDAEPAGPGPTRHRRRRRAVRSPRHIARASPSSRPCSPRRGNRFSRNFFRARWSRTLAADSEIPSSAAMASWGRS